MAARPWVAHEETKMFEARTQRSMEAFERRDLAAIMQLWAEDGVAEFFGRTSLSGRYEGKAAVTQFFRTVFDALSSIRITVRHVALANPATLTWRNTAYIEYVVEETSREGITITDERIAVFEYRRGKVVSMREWAFDSTNIERLKLPAATVH